MMKELQKQFSGRGQVKGYDFKQVTATPFGYIYNKTSLEGCNTFEVFKRLENTLYNVVSYPTDKAFGIWAWETLSAERAKEILVEIEQQAQSKDVTKTSKISVRV